MGYIYYCLFEFTRKLDKIRIDGLQNQIKVAPQMIISFTVIKKLDSNLKTIWKILKIMFPNMHIW